MAKPDKVLNRMTVVEAAKQGHLLVTVPVEICVTPEELQRLVILGSRTVGGVGAAIAAGVQHVLAANDKKFVSRLDQLLN